MKVDKIMQTKLDFETIDMLSKGITQFAFRSGPVEDMHARNKLTKKDMKALNKYMVNRIAVNRTGFNPSKTYKICVGLKPDLFLACRLDILAQQ